MASLHYPVAQQMNANVAGFTGSSDSPTVHPPTAAEHFLETVKTEAGGLGYLFGHSYADAVATPLDRATMAIRGVAGGLVPAAETNIPGSTSSAPLDGVAKTSVSDQIANAYRSIRKAVGI